MIRLLLLNRRDTGVTREKKLVVIVGTKKALAIAVKRVEARRRVTSLRERLAGVSPDKISPILPAASEEMQMGKAAEAPTKYGR
jgi:hypothetical protein